MCKVYKYNFKYVFYTLNGWTQEKMTSNSPCFSKEAMLLDFTLRKKKERKKEKSNMLITNEDEHALMQILRHMLLPHHVMLNGWGWVVGGSSSSSNWILMSCQPHRVTSGQSNSGHKQTHTSKLFPHIHQPSAKSIYNTNHFANTKHTSTNIIHNFLKS